MNERKRVSEKAREATRERSRGGGHEVSETTSSQREAGRGKRRERQAERVVCSS